MDRFASIWRRQIAPTTGSSNQSIPYYENPSLTYAIISFLVAVYFCELYFPVGDVFRESPTTSTLIAFGGLNRSLIANTGELYRIVTAPFLNGSIVPLFFNLIALLMIGPACERLMGRLWFFVIFTANAIMGSLMSLALNSSFITSVGTAGTMTGLFAALYVFSFHLTGEKRNRLQLRVFCTMLLFLWPIANAAARNTHIFNYGAHLGGFLTGCTLGYILLRTWPVNSLAPPLRRMALRTTIIFSILLAVSAVAVASQYSKYERLSWLIPSEELPFSEDDKISRAADLVARWPHDPRGHEYRSLQLQAHDQNGSQAELKTALADAQTLHFLFGTDYEISLSQRLSSNLTVNK